MSNGCDDVHLTAVEAADSAFKDFVRRITHMIVPLEILYAESLTILHNILVPETKVAKNGCDCVQNRRFRRKHSVTQA